MVDKPLLKEKDKPKKKKVKSVSKLKKELDKIFSLYIRNKYAKEGKVRCYTCGVTKAWNEIQNGHFVSRSVLALRYSEENCRPQCVGCNVFGGGKVATFGTKLEEELGQGTIARLYKTSQTIVKNYPYQEKIQEYTQKLKDLNV
jgi:hypothetical protein